MTDLPPFWVEPDGTKHWIADMKEGLAMLQEKGCGAWVGEFGGCNQPATELTIVPATIAFFLFRTAQLDQQPLWMAFLCKRHMGHETIDMPKARHQECVKELEKFRGGTHHD